MGRSFARRLRTFSKERFYALAQREGFSVPASPNFRARVTWNRIRSVEVDPAGVKSRVLLISGPPEVVNEDYLRAYFGQKLIYQVDEILSHGTSEDSARALVEFRFGSYRCQAEAARMALVREFREYGVICEFGRDPCDRTGTAAPQLPGPYEMALVPGAGQGFA